MSAAPLFPIQLSAGQIEVLERFANEFNDTAAITIAGSLGYGEIMAMVDLLEMISPGAGEPWRKFYRMGDGADPWDDDEEG